MTINLVLLAGVVVLLASGVYLLLERSFTRMILGVMLFSNGVNLLIFLTSGSFANAPVVGSEDPSTGDYSDPLPQAFILTAIVITFATLSFNLALLYRSWRLARADTVSDDAESVALRHIDPEADDEVYDEDDSLDTEFGTSAEAAVTGALPLTDIAEDTLTEQEIDTLKGRQQQQQQQQQRRDDSGRENGGAK